MTGHVRKFGSAGLTRQAFQWAFIPIVTLILNAPSVADAQVPTNITSSGLNTTVTHVDGTNTYNITGGTRPGGGPNLFHSFGNFSVGPGNTANFLNLNTPEGSGSISNILGRVTGGNISQIYGTIQTNGLDGFGNANLFLMNPSGIVLGPGASLNVGGSVSFTTAQYIRLFDGVSSLNFYANPANDGLANSILTIDPGAFSFLDASPAAYGFLTTPDPNATITVQGSVLSVPSGQSISLVGGKVVIEGGAQLSAPNGSIKLASAASPGEFDTATLASLPNVDGATFTSFGTINMAPGSSIDVSGTHTVWIKGGQLMLSVNDATLSTSESPAPLDTISLGPGSSITTSNSRADPGADVQLTAETVRMDGAMIQTINSGDHGGGNITIDATTVGLNGSFIMTFTGLDFNTGTVVGDGNGGNVTVQGLEGAGSHADSFTLSNFSSILTNTFGLGKGGEVQLNARILTMDNYSSISTGTFGGDDGQGGGGIGGDVVLNVRTANLLGGASILSQTKNFTPEGGHGGNVIIQGLEGKDNAAELVTLSGGSSLLTQNFGGSNGGRVAITSKSLTLDGADTIINSEVSNVGPGGDIVVSVQQASLSGGATITTKTISSQAGPSLTLQGLQGAGSMADAVVLSGSGTGIISDSVGGTTRAGDVAVRAKTVSLTDGAVIQAATTSTTAAGGTVTIYSDTVDISGGSRILSQASDSAAGQIIITTNTFTLEKSLIATNTQGQGHAGNVVLNAGTVSLSNGANINNSTSASGQAGDITITAQSVTLSNGSSITASSTGTGNAGQVVITSPALTMDHATVTTSTSSTGNAGSITAKVGTLAMTNGSEISSSSTGTAKGQAGSITIEGLASPANAVTITDSSLLTRSENTGQGGSISVHATTLALNNATISASVKDFNAADPHDGAAAGTGNIGLAASTMTMNDSTVTAGSSGSRNAGNITINSGSTVLIQNSSVTTEATQASGGQITINAPYMIRLINSRISTSVAGSTTDSNGGNITIDPDYVILQMSQIRANAFAGKGGAIDITAGLFLKDASSIVDASSTLGISGTVQINAPINNLSEVVARLPESLAAVQTLLRAACAARLAQGQTSSFVERGRDGIPAGPEGLLASPYLPMTSGRSPQLRSEPAIGVSGIQLRRLPAKEPPPSVMVLSDNAACSS